MSVPLECPWTETTEAFFDAALCPDDQQCYERHLESCTTCQYYLDHSDQREDLLRSVGRQMGDPTSTPSDPTLFHMLGQLHEAKSPIGATLGAIDLHFLRPNDSPGVLGTLGDYEVTEVIGQGGMGVVLKAFDRALNRLVAIKVMAAAVSGNDTARRRFTRAAKTAAAVCHEHIVTVHGVYEETGLPYLVMQYIPGESLQARLDRNGPLETVEIVSIGLQTALGLAAAHAHGLIHRDIKPANLLLTSVVRCSSSVALNEMSTVANQRSMNTEYGQVKITDFGLARMTDDVKLTQSGELTGTPEYMAPEQARGETVDYRADLFSLGSVLYAMCTGEPPFRSRSTVAVLRMVSDQSPTPIRELNPDVPVWIETLVNRLMEKDPCERFSSAAEVAKLLEGYLAHLHQPLSVPAPTMPPSPVEVAEMCGKTSRWRCTYWVAAAVFLLSFMGLDWLFQVQNVDPPQQQSLTEFYQDFRGGKPMDPRLIWTGKDGTEVVEPGDKGMRIQLPANRQRKDPVGPVLRSQIKGDVEITASYEILQADQPKVGMGVGVELYVVLDSPERDAFGLCRVKGTNGLDVYKVAHNRTIGGRRRYQLSESKAAARFGQLRMTRKAGEITLAVSEEGAAFRDVASYHAEPADVKEARIAAYPGNATEPVDVRIIDLKVHSVNGFALAAADTSAPGGEPMMSRGWLVAVVIIGLAFTLTLVSLGGWFWLRRKRQANATTDEAAGDTLKPADERAPVISFACGGCGKTIRAKSRLAGLKANCPQCGEPLVVPSIKQTVSNASRSAMTSPPGVQKRILIASAVVLLLVVGILGGWLMFSSRAENDVQGPAGSGRSFLEVVLGREVMPEIEESGFSYQEYDNNQPFRWTSGNAKLIIPLRKGENPQGLGLQLRAYRGPGVSSATLSVLVNGRVIFNDKISLGKWEKTFDLRGIDLGEQLTLELVSDTFNPLGNPQPGGHASDDVRTLGVLVRGVTLLAVFPDTPPPAPAQTIGPAGDPGVRSWKGHGAGVSCLAITGDGGTLVSGSWDGQIRRWGVAANGRSTILPIRVPMISAVAVSPNGLLVATAANNRRIGVWYTTPTVSLNPPALAGTLVGGRSENLLTSIIAAGCVVTTVTQGKLQQFDFAGPAGQVLALAISPDGKTLAAGGGQRGSPGELTLWSLETGKEIFSLRGFKVRLWCLAFAPDGTRLVVGSGDGLAQVISVNPCKVLKTYPHPAYARHVAWSADGKWIAVAFGDRGMVQLYDANTGKQQLPIQVPGGRLVVGLDFSLDGKVLVTSCRDSSVHLWDLRQSSPPVARSRKVHMGNAQYGLLFPDSRTVAVGGDDGAIRLWDTSRGGATADRVVPRQAIVLDGPPEAEREKWREFLHAFNDQPNKNERFALTGPNADKCVKFEPEGLRITLPIGQPGKRLATGVATDVAIKGDFEITIGFEILAEPGVKESAQGTGVFVGFDLDTPTSNLATLTRGSRADAGKSFNAWLSLTDDDSGKPRANILRSFPTKAKKGRLRLLRIGTILYFYGAEGEENTFQLLWKDSFRDEKVQQIQIGGYTGGPEASMDARVRDVRIRTREALDLPAASDLPSAGVTWLATMGVFALGTILTVFVVWLRSRNRLKQSLALASQASRNDSVP